MVCGSLSYLPEAQPIAIGAIIVITAFAAAFVIVKVLTAICKFFNIGQGGDNAS